MNTPAEPALMNWHKTTIEVPTRGKGLHDITETVRAQLRDWGVHEGMCFLFLPHTSASLVISENWDPTARADLVTFMERLVPEREHGTRTIWKALTTPPLTSAPC